MEEHVRTTVLVVDRLQHGGGVAVRKIQRLIGHNLIERYVDVLAVVVLQQRFGLIGNALFVGALDVERW